MGLKAEPRVLPDRCGANSHNMLPGMWLTDKSSGLNTVHELLRQTYALYIPYSPTVGSFPE